MNSVIKKTFGGLSAAYYFRNFAFGLIFPAMMIFVASQSPNPVQLGMIAVLVGNTLLYPYSRFVYEGIVGFVMGANVFFAPAFLMLFVKLMMMAVCWGLAIFIAPVGLAYLYYHHSKNT